MVDFVCFSLKLTVELDGPQHLERNALQHDTRRIAWLASRGFRVIRFRNQQLDEDIRAVAGAIDSALEDLAAAKRNPPSPTLLAEGRESEEDCCAGDSEKILSCAQNDMRSGRR